MLSGCPGHLTARKTEASVQGTLLRGEKKPSTSHLGTTNNHQKCINRRWNRVETACARGGGITLRLGQYGPEEEPIGGLTTLARY